MESLVGYGGNPNLISAVIRIREKRPKYLLLLHEFRMFDSVRA
jgi:hypothetical protein